LQGRLGSLADPPRFILRHRRKNVEGQPRSKRLVARQKFDARIHEVRDERYIARQSVQLGNQEGRLTLPGSVERLRQLGAVRPLTSFNLDKGCHDSPAMLSGECLNGRALRF
jgi:hypothetical protein